MNTITGKAIHTETGLGISNLLVVAYDLDPIFLQSLGGEQVAQIPYNNQQLQRDLYRLLANNQYLSGQNLENYLRLIYFGSTGDREEDSILQTPFGIAGDRLGSILTNEKGDFSLSFDDSAFQINDQEIRPDLVLFLLAPEYSVEVTLPNQGGESAQQQAIKQFVPVPEHLRVLHFTLFPRRNAGRLESFIIKLNSNQLEAQKIPIPTPEDSAVNFAELIKADADRKATIKENLKELRANKLKKHRELEEASQTFIQNLSAVPKFLRESPLFVGQGTTAEQAKIKASEDGITQITPHANFASANIRLSNKDLQALGISGNLETFKRALSQSGSVTETLDLDNVCEFLQQKNGGTELTRRVTDLLEELKEKGGKCDDENADCKKSDEKEHECEVEAGSDESSLSPEEQIKQIVLERVRAMKVLDPEQECFSEDQIKQISKTINNLAPPASPADVTAFYDFQHLQIAFPDVWTEAFDGNVSELIRKMDIQYREYTEELEVVRDPSELNPSDLDDLKDYTRLMEKLVGDIASLDSEPPMPQKVKSLLAKAFVYDLVGNDNETFIKSFFLELNGDLVIESTWQKLSIAQKEELIRIAEDKVKVEDTVPEEDQTIPEDVSLILTKGITDGNAELINAAVNLLSELREPQKTGEVYLRNLNEDEKRSRVLEITKNPEGRVVRVQNILQEVAERLREPHSFRIFQKNTVNFGILTTYRQEWQPGNYQVGSLVSSLPLTPGETRKYTKRELLKKTRSEKENEKFASTVKDERNITSRATSDIFEKANVTNNFEQALQTELDGKLGVFKIGTNTNTNFKRNQVVESQKTKKAFREAVRKASQEYKNERSLEISTEEVSEFESTFTSEISNPNNEITVTYLFYELERQYRVTERLHKLTPVVLVAQEIPNPADIDEDWLLTYEWILRRILLDDSFNDALDYIAEGLVSDEVSLEVKREHYETQKELVEELSETLTSLTSMQDVMRESLIDTTNREKVASAYARRNKKSKRRRRLRFAFSGRLRKLAKSMRNDEFSFGNPDEDADVLEARREALETRLGYLEENLEDTKSQLTAANNALSQATAELTAAIQESFTKRNLVNQLRIHVKDNILYYMQMIWSYEHPDQRYFRLYDIPVEVPIPAQPEPSPSSGETEPSPSSSEPEPPTPKKVNLSFKLPTDDRIEGIYNPLLKNRGLADEFFAEFTLPPPTVSYEEKALHEIADLDNLMGFKGNYMIFPLKQCTYITDFMMQDYLDEYFGLRDPDPVGDFSTDELLCYAEELHNSNRFSTEDKERVEAAITRLVQQRLTSPRIEDELIVVPTGQLFIEALKGEHALLENFKLLHRQLDVKKVDEEVRMAQLENLRHAMRLTKDNPLLDDSNVDKKIVFEGNGAGVIVPPEA
ncbi:MAG: hypothetical protein AAGE96_10065 [Cyanobacteria bacterium P01_G01_bin.19]